MFKWFETWKYRPLPKPNPAPTHASVDTPIRTAAEDLLDRAVLAGRIADMLAAPGVREGRVFAIRGRWGGGKSSLKNLVIDSLARRELPPQHLEFNPWQWGDGETITRALFEQMASRLGGVHSPEAAKRAKALRRYGDMLVGTGGSLAKADEKGVIGWLAAAALLFGGLGYGLADISVKAFAAIALGLSGLILGMGKFLQWRGKDRTAIPLDEVRDDLEARLAALPQPLIVFVDDIDRLEPEQIRMLFRQVKVNANLPNILFVLLYQPSIVEAALQPVAGTEGRDYLEKIVQAHFDLPPVAPEKLLEIFGQQISRLVGHLATEDNGFETVRWGNVVIGGIGPFIRNLRDVRRLLASIEIHLPLHTGRRVFEANLIDFVALEALRVFEGEFLESIGSQEKLLLRSGRSSFSATDEMDRLAIEAMIERVAKPYQEACRSIVRELFPTVGGMVGGMTYSAEDWHSSWYDQKRVCTPRFFSRYFQLQIPDGMVSESDFADLVDAANDDDALASAISGFRSRGALPALVARFDEAVDQLPIEHIDRLMPAILALGEELSSAPGSDGPFNTPFISAWRSASWFLRRVENRRERANILLAAMVETKALAVPSVLISLEAEALEKDEPSRAPQLDEEDVEKLKQAWLQIMTDRANNDPTLLEHDRLVGHLYHWQDYAGNDPPRAWVAQMGSDPARRVKLLRRFLSVGQQTTFGDRVSKMIESYRRESLEPFFDLNELREWLAALDRSKLTTEDARVMSILDKYLAAWKRGERIDH